VGFCLVGTVPHLDWVFFWLFPFHPFVVKTDFFIWGFLVWWTTVFFVVIFCVLVTCLKQWRRCACSLLRLFLCFGVFARCLVFQVFLHLVACLAPPLFSRSLEFTFLSFQFYDSGYIQSPFRAFFVLSLCKAVSSRPSSLVAYLHHFASLYPKDHSSSQTERTASQPFFWPLITYFGSPDPRLPSQAAPHPYDFKSSSKSFFLGGLETPPKTSHPCRPPTSCHSPQRPLFHQSLLQGTLRSPPARANLVPTRVTHLGRIVILQRKTALAASLVWPPPRSPFSRFFLAWVKHLSTSPQSPLRSPLPNS